MKTVQSILGGIITAMILYPQVMFADPDEPPTGEDPLPPADIDGNIIVFCLLAILLAFYFYKRSHFRIIK